MAIRIGADFGLPDINDIHVGEESVNNDILGQSQVTITDKQMSNETNDVDMDTIVIETINDVDMSDAIVFDNVGNEVSISSSTPFDRQSINNCLKSFENIFIYRKIFASFLSILKLIIICFNFIVI